MSTEPWPEGWDSPDRPNSVERAAMLSRAQTLLASAQTLIRDAGRAVEPSGNRCALPRRANYDYQRALQDALKSMTAAEAALGNVIEEVIPPRCRPSEPPPDHIGPWVESHIARCCQACGAVYDLERASS